MVNLESRGCTTIVIWVQDDWVGNSLKIQFLDLQTLRFGSCAHRAWSSDKLLQRLPREWCTEEFETAQGKEAMGYCMHRGECLFLAFTFFFARFKLCV
jgi:hypothetical protein